MLLVAAVFDVVAAVAVVLLVLWSPLQAMLVEACAQEHRARFWMRLSVTELVAGAALCTSTSVALTGLGSPWMAAAAVLRGAFAGLLIGVLAITAGAIVVGRTSAGTGGPVAV